jgi:hypothetical protein
MPPPLSARPMAEYLAILWDNNDLAAIDAIPSFKV